jgi:dihydroneopterin aldolase
MTSDVLRILGMRFYGYHGLLPEESRLGQRFEVDVEIHTSFDGFSRLGADPGPPPIAGAINYPDVYSLTERIVTGERFGLVESLADRIAAEIRRQFGIDRLVVRVRKPDPPVPGQFGGVEVEVRRGF